METPDVIAQRIRDAHPSAQIVVVNNDSPCAQHTLLVDRAHLVEVAAFLKTDAALRMDYISNVTGIDWLDAKVNEKRKVKKTVEGVEQEVEETVDVVRPGYLEVVHHFYSMELKQGPVIVRCRTPDRNEDRHIPSLTPLYRGAELQEREIFDLYGVIFDNHPDLRRLLMWDEFVGFPMRKDYVEPDDYEYEPTPHDDVLTKAKRHYPGAPTE